MTELDPTNPTPENREAALWRWLNEATPQWVSPDTAALTAPQSAAFNRLVLSGQLQLRLHVVARSSNPQPVIHATCVVTGDYKQPLLRAIRGAVPMFTDRIVIQTQQVEYRLSAAGLATQSEMRTLGGGPADDQFLAHSLQFTIPGVANVTDVKDATPATPDHDPPPASKAEPEKPLPAKAPAWPVSKTDGYVAEYCAKHRRDYVALARDVLDERPGAEGDFKAKFGPTAIARHITARVGNQAQRPCRPQDVLKTHTYRALIQPLMQMPPRKPAEWDHMLKDRVGEDRPDILDDIPFEDAEP